MRGRGGGTSGKSPSIVVQILYFTWLILSHKLVLGNLCLFWLALAFSGQNFSNVCVMTRASSPLRYRLQLLLPDSVCEHVKSVHRGILVICHVALVSPSGPTIAWREYIIFRTEELLRGACSQAPSAHNLQSDEAGTFSGSAFRRVGGQPLVVVVLVVPALTDSLSDFSEYTIPSKTE
jgi:hypothetical protein